MRTKTNPEKFLRENDIIKVMYDGFSKDIISQLHEPLKDTLFLITSTISPTIKRDSLLLNRSISSKEAMIVKGYGGVGINTLDDVIKTVLPNREYYTHITFGSLTAKNSSQQLETKWSNNVVFLNEFTTNSYNFISQFKSIRTERITSTARSYGGGEELIESKFNVEPAFFIGCNNIPSVADKPFISRFDGFYIIVGNKEVYDAIAEQMVLTVGKYKNTEQNKNLLYQITTSFDFLKLRMKKLQQDFKEVRICFDNVRNELNKRQKNISDKIWKDNEEMKTIYSRDVEIGIRRINNNTWINSYRREVQKKKGKEYVIYANKEDLEEGIKAIEKSAEGKQKYFELKEKQSFESKSTKIEDFNVFSECWNEIKEMSIRKKIKWLKQNKNMFVNYETCRIWSKRAKILH